jgi:hypothetical protein
METILIILAIVWVVVPILAKTKQKQAKEQAERERLERQRAAQAAALQQAQNARATSQTRTAPLTPSVRPSRSSFVPSSEGTGSQEGMPGAVLQGELTHSVSSNLTEVQSTLTQLNVSSDHEVKPSSESGHAHEETSMSGIDASCPPEKLSSVQTAAAAPDAAPSAFVWNQAGVRNGLVMAEILGPCVAMRE